MCGIVGYLSRRGGSILGRERLVAMRDTMVHRGPDDAGVELFDQGRAGLAHRRLSIIDLSAAGHEPMPYADGRFWLTYNGEVYNAPELRAELEAKGCTFRSTCDAEVILAAYATWGRDCVERLVGMWGFAIWDEKEKTLFCSRDRFGVKPFYYMDDGDLFVFASEIRAILARGAPLPAPRPSTVLAYLKGDIVDGLAETFFEGISRLRPGHNMMVSRQGREVWRYWALEAAPFGTEVPGAEDVARVRAAFEEAVRSHLTSDAPLGVGLSGGIDSSSVFAVASRLGNPGSAGGSAEASSPVRTFTSYYDEPGPYDERRFSDMMTAAYPADEIVVRPGREQLFETLPPLIWHLEEPANARASFPRWHLLKEVGRHVKVLLVGEGADELLGGYSHHFRYLLKDYLIRGRLLSCAREVVAARRQTTLRPGFELLELSKGLARRALPQGLRPPHPPGAAAPLRPDLAAADPVMPPIPRPGFGRSDSWLHERLHYDAFHDILPTTLKNADKTGMAFSVECRVPFLDHRLAELFFSFGPVAKIDRGWTKAVFRRAMEGILPAEVQWRRDKIGWSTPFENWFGPGGSMLDETMARVFDGPLCRDGWLDRAGVEALLAGHRAGRWPLSRPIWQWLAMTVWLEGRANLTDRAYGAPADPARTEACAGSSDI